MGGSQDAAMALPSSWGEDREGCRQERTGEGDLMSSCGIADRTAIQALNPLFMDRSHRVRKLFLEMQQMFVSVAITDA
jgi:hypothetical protein